MKLQERLIPVEVSCDHRKFSKKKERKKKIVDLVNVLFCFVLLVEKTAKKISCRALAIEERD